MKKHAGNASLFPRSLSSEILQQTETNNPAVIIGNYKSRKKQIINRNFKYVSPIAQKISIGSKTDRKLLFEKSSGENQ